MVKSLIIGMGEIGKSLFNVLAEQYEVDCYDKEYSEEPEGPYEVMHICFPYSDEFSSYVQQYKYKFNPSYIVIHSTVPIGSTRKCDADAIHSPVVGVHPNLTQSLKTFTKFLGGELASEIADYFRRAGIKVYITNKPESTELMKLQSTNLYATLIEFYKETKLMCDMADIPYELWTLWNQNYNEGYEKLGYPEYKKPLLIPIMKKQGGHCTLPNLELLETNFTNFLKNLTRGKNPCEDCPLTKEGAR